MASNDYICSLIGKMLLRAGVLSSGPPTLAVSTLVAVDPSTGIASMTHTPPGTGLATMIDGDTGGCAEAGGPATSYPPSPKAVATH